MSSLPPSTEPDVVIPDGDPAELRDVARFLHAAGEALTQVSANVWAANSNVGVCWKGPAAYFFGIRVRETIACIDTVPAACHAAARGLEQLADAIDAARRRALDAQADAAEAHRRIDAAAFEVVASGATQIIDPPAYRLLQRRLDEARDDLHTARALGARANQDLADAGRRTAAILHEAANSVRVPPPPDREVVPAETTRQWFRRQLGDLFVDPITFWSRDKTAYERGRVAFDLYTNVAGGTVDGVRRNANALYKGITSVEQPYLLQIVSYRWIRQSAVVEGTELDLTLYPREYKLGPDPIAGQEIRSVAKYFGIAGVALAAGTAMLDQWVRDQDRRDLSAGKRVGRMLVNTLFTGGLGVVIGMAGTDMGAAAGFAAGSTAPGPGNAIGAVAGGVAGGTYFGGVGQAIGEKLIETMQLYQDGLR